MADEFQLGNGSWWDTSRNRFEGVTTPPASLGWPTDMVAPSGGSNQSFNGGGGHGVLANQMVGVGLGLSSESMNWNPTLLRGEKAESSFRSMLEEDVSSNTLSNFQVMNSAPGLHEINQPMINYPIYSSSGGGYGANDLGSGSHLHFLTNINTTFWNASAPPAAMADARSSFVPADQINPSEVRDLINTTTKKNSTDQQTSNKRPRNETPSPLPPFKVRKEKMGDRITTLQQLVSPFGKTDTASVLSEAYEHIKFIHEQINALSSPYIMKNGAHIHHHQQNLDKYKVETEGPRQDLRSRGLCLVPVSGTFPVTHETTVDFWTPKFGASFR